MAIAGGTGDTAATMRYVPEREFPPYTYVPGRAPHPVTDPTGHSYGSAVVCRTTPDPSRWKDCSEYLRAIDLFNYGYYWESHEMWEAVWIAAGRRGVAADFLKGLIKLAAAGVKCREGSRAGVQRHARRAEQLFRSVRDATGAAFYFGLRMEELLQFTDIAALTTADAASDGRPQVVFAFRLLPR